MALPLALPESEAGLANVALLSRVPEERALRVAAGKVLGSEVPVPPSEALVLVVGNEKLLLLEQGDGEEGTLRVAAELALAVALGATLLASALALGAALALTAPASASVDVTVGEALDVAPAEPVPDGEAVPAATLGVSVEETEESRDALAA